MTSTDLTRAHISRVVGVHRPIKCTIPGLRNAAVLVPLFTEVSTNETHVWLMQRTDDGGAHAGQVSFPGGKHADGDADATATALREAHEELGIEPLSVTVLGVLDDYPTITGFRITPIVGWLPATFEPRPSPREVARVLRAPLAMFTQPGSRNWVAWSTFRRLVRSYDVEGAVVWGATAAILSKLGKLVQEGDQ